MSENHPYNLLDKLTELESRLATERANRDKAKAMINVAISQNRRFSEIEDIQELLDDANNAIATTSTLIYKLRGRIKRQK